MATRGSRRGTEHNLTTGETNHKLARSVNTRATGLALAVFFAGVSLNRTDTTPRSGGIEFKIGSIGR
jgi:hypothetical protein